MSNDSSTGGLLRSYRDSYLTPPLEGQALVDFLQAQIAGLLGFAGDKVRPRWQPDPPVLPTPAIDWAAIGITDREGQAHAYTYHETPKLDEAGRILDHGLETQFLDTGLELDTGLLLDQETPDTLDPESFDIIMRQEEFTLLCSLYGPNADLNASLLREGFSVAQNREPLQLNQIAYVSAGRMTPVPTLVNNKWYYRIDVPLYFRRNIRRVYPVFDIGSANGTLNTDISPIVDQLIVNP